LTELELWFCRICHFSDATELYDQSLIIKRRFWIASSFSWWFI